MKKIIAVILTVLMVVPMSMFFASATATNIAKGASYTYTGAYTDPATSKVLYPDTAAKKLTDGAIGTKEEIGYGGACWVGLNINGKDASNVKSTGTDGKEVTTSTNSVVVDLAAAKDKLTKFVVYALDADSGISMPKGVEAFVSTDGTNYTSAGKAVEAMAINKNDTAHPTYGIHSFTATPAAAVSARYVKFVITHGANWAFISEAEVYQDPNATDTTPAVKEAITVDGKLDDNAWVASGWKHVDSTNATVMNEIKADAPRAENFDFQFRADDTKLYFGFKSNTKPVGTDTIFGNGKGTNLRLWIFNDGFKDTAGNAYTTYNSFIDFQYQPGKVVILAKNNTTYNGNTGVEFTVAGLDVKTSETDKSWYVEAAIPFASIGATTGTHAYIAFSTPTTIDPAVTGTQVTNNSWTYGKLANITQAPVPPATESKEVPSWPYKAWDTANDIDLVFANIKLGNVTEVKPDWTNICGDKIADPQYELAITTKPATYKAGDTITVSISVKNIKPEKGLALIRVLLNYDTTKVDPVIKTNKDTNNEEMNAFLVKSPDAIWAKNGICKLDETKGVYDISFLNEKVTGLAKDDGSLVIEVPFKVKANVTGTIAFQIPHGQNGTNATDIDAKKIYGNAGYALATLATVTPPTSSSSSTSSKGTVPTGDSGIYAIALIAMIALAGAATVAVKKRSR